jgi:signal transduction histidine kinase
MTKEQTISLDSLRAALDMLQEHTIPVKTRTALQEVISNLELLTRKLEESEEQSRLVALYRVSQMLGESLNLDDVLNQVMDAVIELTGAERGFLMLHDTDTDRLDLRAARNFERENLEKEGMEVSRTVIRSVLDSGEGVVTINAQDDPRFAMQESVIAYALRSIMCAPLTSRGKTFGVIYVDNRAHIGTFEDDDLDLLNTFATQAAVAIENARLYTQTDQTLAARVQELEVLTDIDRDLNQELDLAKVVEITVSRAIKGTGASAGWLALYNEESNLLGVVTETNLGKNIEMGDELVAAAFEKRTPQIFFPRSGQLAQAVVPLISSDQTIGVMVLESSHILLAPEIDFLTRLGARASSALENARLYQAVHDANLAKSKFVSVVSHELRLPMTSIKGYTDLLLQGAAGDNEEMKTQFLHVIRNNVERMRILVSDLSDVSRIESGKLRLETAPLSMTGYIDQVLTDLQPKFEERKQTLALSIPDDMPLAYADPNRLIQILTNLISNAWKYTPDGGHIQIKAEVMDGFVKLSVVDNGLGISDEDQAKLFTQFFRSESDDVRAQQGWGLGLNVTKHLVELMGGEIGMTSVFEEGSTFWFTLPIYVEGQELEEQED